VFSTARSERIAWSALALMQAGLGIWALADGRYGPGAYYMVAAAVWALFAVFVNTLRARRRPGEERRRKRLEERYGSRPIPPPPAHPLRWSSPDNPPGWYLNPATKEPGYWSELGWWSPRPS
jgi:hypothetical protein